MAESMQHRVDEQQQREQQQEQQQQQQQQEQQAACLAASLSRAQSGSGGSFSNKLLDRVRRIDSMHRVDELGEAARLSSFASAASCSVGGGVGSLSRSGSSVSSLFGGRADSLSLASKLARLPSVNSPLSPRSAAVALQQQG